MTFITSTQMLSTTTYIMSNMYEINRLDHYNSDFRVWEIERLMGHGRSKLILYIETYLTGFQWDVSNSNAKIFHWLYSNFRAQIIIGLLTLCNVHYWLIQSLFTIFLL